MNNINVKFIIVPYIIVFLIAVIIAMVALFMFPEGKLQTTTLSVGGSMIASALISILVYLYLRNNENKYGVVDEWGISGIGLRQDMNKTINKHLDKMKIEMCIIALGMKSFLSAKEDILKEKLKNGVNIKILTMDPESEQVAVRESAERVASGAIKRNVTDMLAWVDEIKRRQDIKGNIEVRKYDGEIMDTYQCIDGEVFVGPHEPKKVSQQSITFHFKKGSKGADYFQKNFNRAWTERKGKPAARIGA